MKNQSFFQKKRIYGLDVFFWERRKMGCDSGFWAEAMKKSKDFRKKLRFLLSVCRKNLNIHNEHTVREDQLPAKRKETV